MTSPGVTFKFSPLVFLLRVGATIFIGLNAPWYVTVLAVLLQVQVARR